MLYLSFLSKSFSHEKIVLRISKKSQSVNDWLFKWGSGEIVNAALTSILIGSSERSRLIYPSTKGCRFKSYLLHKSVQDYKTVPIYSFALELHVKKKEYGGTVDALVLGISFFGFESQYSHKTL